LTIGLFVGHSIPKVVSESEALKEMANCHLITADNANADKIEKK
jgi:hypothetical protein